MGELGRPRTGIVSVGVWIRNLPRDATALHQVRHRVAYEAIQKLDIQQTGAQAVIRPPWPFWQMSPELRTCDR